jgi:hypothetical protein
MKKVNVAALLSFNGGFLDTAGFLALQGLFTARRLGPVIEDQSPGQHLRSRQNA